MKLFLNNYNMSDLFIKDKSGVGIMVGMQSDNIKVISEHFVAKKEKKSKKKMLFRSQLRRARKKAGKFVTKAIWGNHMDNFNTIRDTQFFISFFWMQVIRLFMLLSLICIFGIYFYIYLRSMLYYYNCLALFFTTMAFLFLLIGSGK